MLAWWVICFIATGLVVFGKWYFSNNVSRMRQALSRQHRETLELKDSLQDARAAHTEVHRQIKHNELDIARSKKRMAELKSELSNLKGPQANKEKLK